MSSYTITHEKAECFYDGYERKGEAKESDVAAFRKSWQRPKWHVLTQ